MAKKAAIEIPEGMGTEVLLHACCAPCSSAIVEWMLEHGLHPTIFYYNPNIWPREEYEIRKEESKQHAERLGIRWIDGDYDHEHWLEGVCDLKDEPERGRRCEQCFTLRLIVAARKAKALGLKYFTTTLASSRWKSLEQIEMAGHKAEQTVEGVAFWAQNWRKGGLYERRNALLKAYGFYNQQYCGCEFSAHRVQQSVPSKAVLRNQMRDAKRQHAGLLSQMSTDVVARLGKSLSDANIVMAYWPLPDEVDIRPLLTSLLAAGKTVVLPKVTGDETMELRRMDSEDDLKEGAFHIMEPVGEPFEDYDSIDVALVPGVAFDAAGHRLGRGRGYYDRFLADKTRLLKVGVCFPFQRIAWVPTDANDVTMDKIG